MNGQLSGNVIKNHLGISDTLITYLEIVLAEQSHMSIEEGVEEEE